MSPRAACRLEAIGFTQVYDYTAGIADWKAAGLPVEGSERPGPLVGDATRTDIPTASPDETLAQVQARAEAAGWDESLVVDCGRVVVGRLRGRAWTEDPAMRVDAVMELGPTTVRPDGALGDLVERMDRRGTRLVVVTDPQGRLLGALLADDARRLLAGDAPEQIWRDCDGCGGRAVPNP